MYHLADEIRHFLLFRLILAQEWTHGVCSASNALLILCMRHCYCTSKGHERRGAWGLTSGWTAINPPRL